MVAMLVQTSKPYVLGKKKKKTQLRLGRPMGQIQVSKPAPFKDLAGGFVSNLNGYGLGLANGFFFFYL